MNSTPSVSVTTSPDRDAIASKYQKRARVLANVNNAYTRRAGFLDGLVGDNPTARENGQALSADQRNQLSAQAQTMDRYANATNAAVNRGDELKDNGAKAAYLRNLAIFRGIQAEGSEIDTNSEKLAAQTTWQAYKVAKLEAAKDGATAPEKPTDVEDYLRARLVA